MLRAWPSGFTRASKICARTGRRIISGIPTLKPKSVRQCIGCGRRRSPVRSTGQTSRNFPTGILNGGRDEMTSPLLGEFMGTAVLILLGNGVVANVLLRKSKGEGGGWIVITAGWAFAVLCGVFTAIACGSKDAHLNPAVTLGFAVVSGNFEKLVPYMSAQILGAIVGATLVWLHYLPHWKETPEPGLKLACYSTSPVVRN